MARSMARLATRLAMVVALVAVPTLTLVPGSNAVTAAPTLKMLTILHHADAFRCCSDPSLYIYPGMYISAVNGAFEVDATKGTDGKITLWQVRRDSTGVHQIKKINPPSAVSIFDGLP